MKIHPLIIMGITIQLSYSCEKLFMESPPKTDNRSIFNDYSQICIEKFGLEEVKGVDLRELADSIRPYISPNLSEQKLFDFMSIFVERMQEGHTQLTSMDGKFHTSYNWLKGYPKGIKPTITDNYYYGIKANSEVQILEAEQSNKNILFGFLPQNKQIGYLRIPSFKLNIGDNEVSMIMKYLKDAKGLIIDVRENLGGYHSVAALFASYLIETETEVGTKYIKNGPGKNEFASNRMFIKASGSPYTFTRSIMVLHDRSTFSAASEFCVMMNAIDHVTTIGIRFGGGTGEIMDGFLQNGWKWQISTANFVDILGRPTDPGLDADIPMELNPGDKTSDKIIERAIAELDGEN